MTNSDANAKKMCKKFLEREGFVNVAIKGSDGYDIEGFKDGKKYYFEVKSSSRRKNDVYSGTVMLTELYKAIENKENYRFIICRGQSNDIDKWTFELFEVDEFMEFCALTTPILRYGYHPNPNKQPKFNVKTKKANDELIRLMWSEYGKWKEEQNEEELEEIIEEMDSIINLNKSWSDIKDNLTYDFGRKAIDELLNKGVNDEPDHRRFTKSIKNDIFSYIYIVFAHKHIHLHINVKNTTKAKAELDKIFQACKEIEIKEISSGLSLNIKDEKEYGILKKWLNI